MTLMAGHLIRAELSLSDSVDVKLIERQRRSTSLLLDVEYEGSDYASAVVRILDRFLGDARSYGDVTVRVPCHRVSELRHSFVHLGELLAGRADFSDLDLRFLLNLAGVEAQLIRWTGAGFQLLERSDLERVRENELLAIVEHYGALHSEATTRFILPSGGEASAFLRMGDVLRSQRDCQVIAYWCLDAFFPVLREASARASLSILIDTPALLPICYEVWRLMEQGATSLGRISVAPSYPHAGGEVDSLIRGSVGSADLLLCLVSASASGVMASLFVRSVERVVGPSRGSVVVLASIGEHPTPADSIGVPVLCHVREPIRQEVRAPAITIRVEPSTMAFLPWESEDRSPPVVVDADSTQAQWLAAIARHEALGVECLPHSGRGLVRPRSGLMAFRMLPDELAPHAAELVPLLPSGALQVLRGDPRTVIVLPSDLEIPGGAGPIAGFLGAVGVAVQDVISVDHYRSARPSGRVLCFAWGSVTGHSAADLVRTVRQSTDGSVDLFLLYFRPPSMNDRSILEASVADGSLIVGWEVLVPWSSAFEPEALLLTDFLAGSPQDPDVGLYDEVLDRLNKISPIGEDQDWKHRRGRLGRSASQVLWCDRLDVGEHWTAYTPTLLFAAATELMRLRSDSAGRFRLNLRSAIEASDDPRWLAALLREAERGEIVYWQSSSDRAKNVEFVADWMLTDRDESGCLLAEFLCADALGKIPDDLALLVIPRIRARLENGDFVPDDEPSIRLLLSLNAWSRGTNT